MRNWRAWWPEAAIVLVALALRLVLLDLKPAHFDEGVNGSFVDGMTQQGYYHYDPTNFHGPLHFYILFFFQTLLGRAAWVLRLPIALISAACVVLALGYRRYFGVMTCRIAALGIAVSPAMTFYGRYAIHESFLLLSLMLTVWGILGLWRFGARRDLWAAALGVTGMILTKETYVIHVAALLLAVPAVGLLEYCLPSAPDPPAKQHWTEHDLKWVLAVSLGLIVFFYSGCFLDWSSVKGLWETFATWTRTGTARDGGHAKDWDYWLQLMTNWPAIRWKGHLWPKVTWHSDKWQGAHEAMAFVGLLAATWVAWPKRSLLLRYIAVSAVGTLVAYSIIPYKTPWCLIVMLWPFYFTLGALLEWSAKWLSCAGSWAVAALLLAPALYLTIRLNFFHYADETEDYVYVQTTTDVRYLLDPLRKLTRDDPANFQLTGQILFEGQGDAHPLPWLLGDFPHVGFLSKDTPASSDEAMNADFLLIQDAYVADVEDRVKHPYFRQTITVRGSSGIEAYLYFKASRFAALFPGREPEFVPYTEEEKAL